MGKGYNLLCEKTEKEEPCEGCDRSCQYLYKVSPGRAVTRKLRLEIYQRDEFKCVLCKVSHPLSIDHITPLSHGGTNDKENLQTMCIPCNNKKAETERL